MQQQMYGVDPELLKTIRQNYPSPIVGIIGSTAPDESDYSPLMSIMVAQQVHDFCNAKKGSCFTGGVGGVGVDAFMGIALKAKGKPIGSDRFFILIPEQYAFAYEKHGEEHIGMLDYNPPYAYNHMAQYIGKDRCNTIVAGEEMSARRRYVAQVADILVMVNGSGGTLHEGLLGLSGGKPLIVVSGTGGMADVLAECKRRDSWLMLSERLDTLKDVDDDPDMNSLYESDIEGVRTMLNQVFASLKG